MKTQEEVFNSIPALARELKGLARYVQNDLDYMIRNNDTNLESLKEHKAMFIGDVKSLTDDLLEVYKDVAIIYDEAINNYDKIKGNKND